jgi:ferritin-like metal-binding protein YciE
MRLNTLQDLLIDQLHDLFSIDIQVTESLPLIIHAAASADLKQALKSHLSLTKNQLNRLHTVFQKLAINPNQHTCHGITGLIKDENEIINREGDPAVKDAAIIAAAQKVKQYEISAYSTIRTYARELGYNDIADLLQETINEDNELDKQLTSLAKGGFFSPGINEEAPKQ